MKSITIKATTVARKAVDAPPLSVTVSVPEDVDEAIVEYGKEVVFQKYNKAIVLEIQAALRAKTAPDKDGNVLSDEEVVAKMADWKPVLSHVPKDRVAKTVSLIDELDEEETEAALEQLNERLKALGFKVTKPKKKAS